MRLGLLCVLAIAGALTLPTAVASPARVDLLVADGPVVGNATVPVTVRLTIGDFSCHGQREFAVRLYANATEGVKALFATSQATLHVEPHMYYVETYREETTVDLTVRSLREGQVEITAAFEADAGPCSAPGGFEPAFATLALAVVPGDGSLSPEETESAPEAPPTVPATPTPAAGQERPTTTCAPGTPCGFIGEYEAPAESRSETPAPAVALLLAVAILVALTRRKA